MSDDVHRIEGVKVVDETVKAVRVQIDDRQVWIPKSVIHDDSEVWKIGTEGELVVARWFAEKEGLE